MQEASTLAAGPSELTPRVREEIRASELTTERRVITEAARPYRIVHAAACTTLPHAAASATTNFACRMRARVRYVS